jgi:hypothetical protein
MSYPRPKGWRPVARPLSPRMLPVLESLAELAEQRPDSVHPDFWPTLEALRLRVFMERAGVGHAIAA